MCPPWLESGIRPLRRRRRLNNRPLEVPQPRTNLGPPRRRILVPIWASVRRPRRQLTRLRIRDSTLIYFIRVYINI